jgi:hypothetical protein
MMVINTTVITVMGIKVAPTAIDSEGISGVITELICGI